MMLKKLLTSLCFALLILSCKDKDECSREVSQAQLSLIDQAQLAIDNALIVDYISANAISDVQEVNGIKYVITKQGSGVIPCLGNSVAVLYRGKFLSNGNTFDSSVVSPAEFPLNQLILGWQLTFTSFPVGTSATIFIPSGYGYGPGGFPPRIPANANLIFDIELVNVR